MSETRIPTQKRSIEKRNKIIAYGFELMCNKGYYMLVPMILPSMPKYQLESSINILMIKKIFLLKVLKTTLTILCFQS